jgi:hypothetical protein
MTLERRIPDSLYLNTHRSIQLSSALFRLEDLCSAIHFLLQIFCNLNKRYSFMCLFRSFIDSSSIDVFMFIIALQSYDLLLKFTNVGIIYCEHKENKLNDFATVEKNYIFRRK